MALTPLSKHALGSPGRGCGRRGVDPGGDEDGGGGRLAAARIGIWGSSYSGGHVLVVAATDRRVKAVVSQVPLVSGHDNLRALVRSDFIAGFREMFDADRLARFEGKPPAMVPVVDADPLAPSALPTADSWQWFTETG